jgi:hypothetical protein
MPRDRDVLQFLWVENPMNEKAAELKVFRFKRVVFGVASSPFFLNSTVRHPLECNSEQFPHTVPKLIRSTYVDDMLSGASNVEEAFKVYCESKELLRKGGFNLCKFITNSFPLHMSIQEKESFSDQQVALCKVHGVHWDVTRNELVIDISEVVTRGDLLSPTKR